MKNLVLIIIFTCLYCKGQNTQNKLNTKKMTQKLDTFDIVTYEKNKDSKMLGYDFYLENGNFVHQSESETDYTEKINKKGTKYSVFKSYYKSGSLKDKVNLYDDFFIGYYFKYDENGKTIEKRDYDKYFEFTLEDVLKYCKENNIVEKKNPKFNQIPKIRISRSTSYNLEKNDSIYWVISYGLVPYTPKGNKKVFMCFIKTTLDGKTGKVIKKEYKRARIDKKWQLIENY